MLSFPPPKRPRRGRVLVRPLRPKPPAVPLELVAAEYDANETTLRMTFDRAVDISAIKGDAFTVADGVVHGYKFHVVSAQMEGPATVVAALMEFDSATKPETTLTVSAANGIVAVDDGGTWEGVEGVGLPYEG